MDISRKDDYLVRLIEKCRLLGIEDLSENSLVSNFVANYDFYQSILEKSLSDGVISVDDKVELYKYRASMVTDDLKLIKEDELSPENIEILREILKIIDEMRSNEEGFPSLV